ncbi:MAG: HAD-IA family hydrolase [Candidatus Omnitrophica bacterium]|nr:HAD-IA family hydrolase [Candidatus Omnitrophota bacterium]
MQTKYDVIICDLGSVLVNFDHRIAVKKIMQHTPKAEEDIYNLFFDSGITELYEEGRISSSEFFSQVKDALQLDMDCDGFFPVWNDIFFETELNIKVRDFLRKIRPRYKLVMLSNLNMTHFEFLKKTMDNIFDEFHKLVLSYEVGFRKPAPQIYKVALDFAKTSPERAFYIDDRRDLVDAAAGLGIKGVVFNGERALDSIRRELG